MTASFFRRTPEQAVSVQRLSFEEIRRSPGGFEDVVRAVAVFPGVAQVSAGRNDLIVRGGAPSENIYVVDNLEIPNINHFGTQGSGGGPLSYINLDFVRETSFSTGGFGARYGDRLSSVLTIDLREGRTDRLGGKATISATQFGLNLEGPIGENGTFLVSARRSYLDLIFRASGFSFVPEYWDFFARGDVHARQEQLADDPGHRRAGQCPPVRGRRRGRLRQLEDPRQQPEPVCVREPPGDICSGTAS